MTGDGDRLPTGRADGLQLGDEVHVWWVDLRTESPEPYLAGLDDAERARASRLRSPEAYRAFVVTRVVLRRLLAAYLGLTSRVDLHYGPQGKPSLVGDPLLAFNVSHAQTRAVLAFRRHGRVGVDVEEVRATLAAPRIAERFFAPAENAALRALPGDQWQAGFFRCWTRKEAFIKAVGDGLSHDLRSFAVSVDPTQPATLSSDDDANWHLVDLEAGEGHTAALAVSGSATPPVLRLFHWPGAGGGGHNAPDRFGDS